MHLLSHLHIMYACLSLAFWAAWIKGAKGENCEQVCRKEQGAICDASKQSELTSYIAVAAAFKEAGYICKNMHEARSHAGTPFSTGRDSDDCAAMVPGQKSSCDENQFADHSALCYCRSSCVFFACVCACRVCICSRLLVHDLSGLHLVTRVKFKGNLNTLIF